MLRISIALLVLAGTAHAQPADTSYRGTMAAADIGAAALFAGVATTVDDNTQSMRAVVPGALAFALSGPIVHLAHGNVRGAARSLALRTALPVLGGLAGWYLLACGPLCPGREFGIPYAQEGVLLGDLAASAIDTVLFADIAPAVPRRELPASTYSTSLLLADLAGTTAVVAMAVMPVRQSEPVVAALAGYLAFAPAVHLLHGNQRGAAVSLVLRIGLPLAGGLAGYAMAPRSCYDGCDGGQPAIGAILGGLLAMGIDDVVLPNRQSQSTTSIAPILAPSPGGATVGMSGAF